MADPLPWPSLDPMPDGWLGDTPGVAVDRWRRMTPADRYVAALRARATALVWVLAGERMRHPGEDEAVLRSWARRRLSHAAG